MLMGRVNALAGIVQVKQVFRRLAEAVVVVLGFELDEEER